MLLSIDSRLWGTIVSASLGTSVSESEDKFILDDSDSEARSMTGTPDSRFECFENWGSQGFWPGLLTRGLCSYTCLNLSVAGAYNESMFSVVFLWIVLSARSRRDSNRLENSSKFLILRIWSGFSGIIDCVTCSWNLYTQAKF